MNTCSTEFLVVMLSVFLRSVTPVCRIWLSWVGGPSWTLMGCFVAQPASEEMDKVDERVNVMQKISNCSLLHALEGSLFTFLGG